MTKRQIYLFSALCCLVYFSSYITRLNYMAAISEIAISLQISNQLAGMAVIGSFIAYGIGQPIFGMLGDHFKPRNLIFLGLFASAFCNLAVSFLSSIYLITALWCLNGIFQSMLWPPLVRIMAQTLSPEHYRKASVQVISAASIGTIAVYLLVPFSILYFNWRFSFYLPAAFTLIVAFVWFFSVQRFQTDGTNITKIYQPNTAEQPSPYKLGSLIAMSGLFPIMIIIIFQGTLRDGITTWMPTYIQDIYQMDTSSSILSAAVLPIFTIVIVYLVGRLQAGIRNELKSAALIWMISLIATSILIGVYASNAVVSILLLAIITGCSHGINLLLISHLPMHFAKYGKASTISGLLNAFAYLGSAISIYGIATLTDIFSWKFTIITWVAISFMGLGISAAGIKKWRNFTQEVQSS